MIQQTDSISISGILESIDMDPPGCELLIDGKPIGKRFHGDCLRMAFRCDAGYLVFLIEDHLFEENLNVYFLSFSGVILDSASIFSGNFRNVQIRQPDSTLFEFFESGTFKIKVSHKPMFRLPIFSDPLLNFRRPFGFSGFLKITEIS